MPCCMVRTMSVTPAHGRTLPGPVADAAAGTGGARRAG
ncbi:hypothetical protein DA2_1932 [Desulfovibrio sp. A2]|nr:hypothetical protein DA2_1932 [Desulfovibrio sp. A2]